jgi:ribosome-associated protein
LELADAARTLLDDKKAQNTVLLDVRGQSTVTDYYLITTGLSAPHLKAMFNDLQVALKKLGVTCHRKSGEPEGGWMVLDYFDVIIHIFLPEQRQYYALESLWDPTPETE